MSKEEGATAVYPKDLKVGDKIAPHGDDLYGWETIVRITMDDKRCHFCIYTDKMPDYPILFSRADLVRVARAQGPREPLEENERLRFAIATVRGHIIGALAGGHMDGKDGAAYSKNILLQIADALEIEIPESTSPEWTKK